MPRFLTWVSEGMGSLLLQIRKRFEGREAKHSKEILSFQLLQETQMRFGCR